MFRSRKKDTKSSARLGQVKFGLNILAAAADGAINVPGLKAAVLIAVQIIEVVEQMKSNKDDCATIAERICDLVEALHRSTENKAEADVDSRLRDDLQRFGRDLETIRNKLLILASRDTLRRFLHYREDSSNIISCKDMLDQSFKVFQVYSGIQLRLGIAELLLRDPDMDKRPKNIQLSRTPPPMPRIFFGRDDLVQEGVLLIKTHQAARLAILGTGGIGKTCLALALLHHKEVQDHFQGRCVFVPCEGAHSANALIHSILNVLGADADSGKDPLTTMHHYLLTSDSVMIVLDNFETPWHGSDSSTEVEDILLRIASEHHVTLVVTMRGTITLPGVEWITMPSDVQSGLPPLSPEAARQAYLAHSFTKAEKTESYKELDKLLHDMGYIPLAVVLVAQLGKHDPPAVLLKRWKKEKTKLLQAHGSKLGRLTSIDFSISMSLNSPIILKEPEAKELLALIANLPDGVFNWSETLEDITPSFKGSERLVALLRYAALVYIDSIGTLKMFPPIQQHVLENYHAAESHMIALEKYYTSLLGKHNWSESGPTFITTSQALLNINNINSIVTSALIKHPSNFESPLNAANCLQSLGNILISGGRYDDARQKLEDAQAQHVNLNNPFGVADCISSLGNILHQEARYAEAKQELENAYAQYINIGSLRGAANCLLSLGNILSEEGKYADAKLKLDDAYAYYIKVENSQGAANCIASIGQVLYEEGKYEDARQKLETAHSQLVMLGSTLNAANCTKSLGYILYQEGKHKDAKLKLEEAQAEFVNIGYPLGIAQCLKHMADIMFQEGKYTDAKQMLETVHAQFIKIGHLLGATTCMESLGEILIHEENYADARQALEKAHSHYVKIGHRAGEANSLKKIGQVLYMNEEYEEAKLKLEGAQLLYTKIDDSLGLAITLCTLGNILFMEENYGHARVKVQQAYQEYVKLGTSIGMADCLQTLGKILAEEEVFEEAKKKLEEAEKIYTEANMQYFIADCYENIAKILILQGQYELASEKLNSAQLLYSLVEDHARAKECQDSLTEIAEKWKVSSKQG